MRPPKPPDDGGGVEDGRISFRDKLMGEQTPATRKEKVDLLAQNLFKMEWDEGDRLKPRCYIADALLDELRKPWKDVVIVTLLGKKIGY